MNPAMAMANTGDDDDDDNNNNIHNYGLRSYSNTSERLNQYYSVRTEYTMHSTRALINRRLLARN